MQSTKPDREKLAKLIADAQNSKGERSLFFWVVGLWFAYLGVLAWIPAGRLLTGNAGTFGDSFGGLNTLFTGLAFAGLLLSLRDQRKDLEIQAAVLQLQLDELTTQGKALENQNLELRRSAEAQSNQVKALQLSADAQERAAVALERSAAAQVRAADIAVESEKLRAVQVALAGMGTHGSGQEWAHKRQELMRNQGDLINSITQLTGSSGAK
jgi:hypothetical protein